MNDNVIQYKKSLIQHGKINDRIYLMKLAQEDCPDIIGYLDELASTNRYSKIIAKVPASLQYNFLQNQYKAEAYVENFFKGSEDCYFLSKYFDEKRAIVINKEKMSAVKDLCTIISDLSALPVLTDKYKIRQLNKNDAGDLANIYGRIFSNYPFPISEQTYLQQTMQDNVEYFGVFYYDKLVAVASSEMDIDNKNTEMTDFATLPQFRTMGLSRMLLSKMERAAKQKGIVTAYTIARATSYGINIMFAKGQYKFSGVLINNTNICEGIESMNVWAKRL